LQREAATSKIKDRRARLQPRLRLLWRIAFAMIGQQERARRLRFSWGPIEFVTLIESAEASQQATGTLSTEDRLERCWQMTPEERARNMQRLTADQITAAAAAAAGAAQATPPGGQSTTPPGRATNSQPSNGRAARPQPAPTRARNAAP
jgi:hypothetical protein